MIETFIGDFDSVPQLIITLIFGVIVIAGIIAISIAGSYDPNKDRHKNKKAS